MAKVRSELAALCSALDPDSIPLPDVTSVWESFDAMERLACELPGCNSTTALEIDHIEDWHKTFRTKLDALAWHCRLHHLDKTHRGWRLEGPPGGRRWGAARWHPNTPGHLQPPAR